MTKDETLKLALEALEEFGEHYDWCHQFPTYAFPENYPPCNCGYDEAITAIKEALAQPEQKFDTHSVSGKSRDTHSRQPEQEPVGEIVDAIEGAFKCSFTKMLPVGTKLYTTPPQRTWVGLTDEERKDIELGIEVFGTSVEDVLKEAEAKLKEKNT